MQLNTYIDEHYLPAKKATRGMNTVVGYESSIDLYIRPRFGDREIESLTPMEIQDWALSIPTPGGAEKAYKTLRQVIRHAIRNPEGTFFVGDDPTLKEIELPRKSRHFAPTLEMRELREMLRGFYGHDLEALVLTVGTCGLRRSEGCGLNWDTDFDLRTGCAHIQRSMHYIKGQRMIQDTKTKESNRLVYFMPSVKSRLREIKGQGWIVGDLNPDAVARIYKAHCKRESLPYVPLQNLRHTWGTAAVESGADIAAVSLMMGHTEIDTTRRYYLMSRRSVCQRVQKGIENLLLE